MSRWSLVLRVVLCWSLALDGVSTANAAHAGVMHANDARHAVVAQESPAAATDEGAPCHGSHATPATDEPFSPEDPAPTQSGDTVPVCCLLAACGGACLQHPPAAMGFWIPTVVVTRTTDDVAMPTPHASPDLAHLIRPPNVRTSRA